jgi:lipoprotein-anchoring transpeptidase ErfK/SrfK
MKKAFQLLIALGTVLWAGTALASQSWVIINLSEQRAYLVERGRVTLISPIASGKPGWSTPTGSFSRREDCYEPVNVKSYEANKQCI